VSRSEEEAVDDQELLAVPDVAVRLKVTQETVRHWLRTQRINGYNLGGRAGWRIPAGEVRRLLIGAEKPIDG